MNIVQTYIQDTYLRHEDGCARDEPSSCRCDVQEVKRGVPIVRVKAELPDVGGSYAVFMTAGEAWEIAQLQARLEWGA
jgi:hypothetical protein